MTTPVEVSNKSAHNPAKKIDSMARRQRINHFLPSLGKAQFELQVKNALSAKQVLLCFI